MTSPSKVYELKKMGCKQNKDGWDVTLRVHPEDFDSPLVSSPAGTVLNATVTEERYEDAEQ